MGRRGGFGGSRCHMAYRIIRKEIDAKGRRGRAGQFQLGNMCWARLDGEDIRVKLYYTDIIVYHPDGTRTLNGKGWAHSQLTRKWWWEARLRVYTHKLNKWSYSINVLAQYDRQYVPFFDGMKVDGDGQLIGDAPPIMMRVPNAEAKEHRRQLLARMPLFEMHLRFLDLCDDWEYKIVQYEGEVLPVRGTELFLNDHDPTAVVYSVLRHRQHRPRGFRHPHRTAFGTFKSYLDSQYEAYVAQHHLYDEVPYQPKEK